MSAAPPGSSPAGRRRGRTAFLDQVRAEEPALGREAPGQDTAPARCAIREHCRWHRQDGPAACSICPLVITDLLPAASP